MYTGLRIKATVKEEFRQMIEEINNGADWSEFAEQFPFLSAYAKQGRAEFIPCGSLSYMPDEWEYKPRKADGSYDRENAAATDGFERSIDRKTGYWTFQCSLKNYNQEIEQFLEEVLPNIIESAEHIEYLYEEWDKSVMYKYSNGNIVAVK